MSRPIIGQASQLAQEISVWGGKGVKGGVRGRDRLSVMNTCSTTESCWGCRPRLAICLISKRGSRVHSIHRRRAFAGGSAIVGYNFGQVTPYVITGMDFVRATRASSGGAFNASDAVNTVFSGPGAVQAVGTFGVGVNYRITSNFSMGLEAIVHTNSGGALAPWP